MKFFFFFFFFLAFYSTSNCQSKEPIRSFDKFDTILFFEKTLPPIVLMHLPIGADQAFKIALSYFPELKAKKIIFKFKKISTTLNAWPTIGTLLFSKRDKRSYVIRVNTTSKDSVVLLSDVPFNAKIGLFAHELSHFIDYQNNSFFGILGYGLSYLSKKKKAQFEKEIDLATIQKGLGWQLYDWSDFVLNQSNASEHYKKFKEEIYLEPSEIKLFIEKSFPE